MRKQKWIKILGILLLISVVVQIQGCYEIGYVTGDATKIVTDI